MNTSTSTTGIKAFTIADIEKSIAAIESLPTQTQWMLAAPDGRCWQGLPEDLLNVLLPYHRLLKPLTCLELLQP